MSRSPRGLLRLSLAFVSLLAAMLLVVYRQSRALELMRSLEDVRTERALLEGERGELVRRIQELESRGRIVSAARSRLGMHVPTGDEISLVPVLAPFADEEQAQ